MCLWSFPYIYKMFVSDISHTFINCVSDISHVPTFIKCQTVSIHLRVGWRLSSLVQRTVRTGFKPPFIHPHGPFVLWNCNYCTLTLFVSLCYAPFSLVFSHLSCKICLLFLHCFYIANCVCWLVKPSETNMICDIGLYK